MSSNNIYYIYDDNDLDQQWQVGYSQFKLSSDMTVLKPKRIFSVFLFL